MREQNRNINVRVTLYVTIYVSLKDDHNVQPLWYDGVMTWKRVPHNWPFLRGIHRSLVDYTKANDAQH